VGVGGLEMQIGDCDWRLAIGIGVASGVPVRGVNAGNSFVAEPAADGLKIVMDGPSGIEGAALGATLASTGGVGV